MDNAGSVTAPTTTEEARASWKVQLEELKQEAQIIQPILEELYTDIFPPKFVADEFTAGGKVAAGLFAAYKLLRIVPLNEAVFAALRQGMLAAAGLYLGWRLASGCLGRLSGAIQGHRRRRRAIMRRWQALTERIERLQQLADTAWGQEAVQATMVSASALPSAATAAGAGAASMQAGSAGAGMQHAATDALSSLESAGPEISSSLELEESALEVAAGGPNGSPLEQQQQQQTQHPPQRAGWGSGLAGWSQLYGGRVAPATPAAAAPQRQQQRTAAAAAGAAPPFPGGSPVLLQTPWPNDDADDEEDWEQPQFAAAEGSGQR